MTKDVADDSAIADVPPGWGGLQGGWAYSPDGSVLGGPHGWVVSLLDAETWVERLRLVGHAERVRLVAFSPDGTVVASASADGSIRLWEANTGAPRAKILTATGLATQLAFAPDGTALLAVCGGAHGRTLFRWDVPSGEPRGAHPLPAGVASAISPDGKMVAVAGESSVFGTVTMVDAISGATLREMEVQGQAGALEFDRPSRHLVGEAHGQYYVWESHTGSQVGVVECDEVSVPAIALRDDGGALAIAGADGERRLLDLGSGSALSAWTCGSVEVRTVAWRPGRATVAVGGNALDEAEPGRVTRSLSTGTDRACAIAVSPDGHTVAYTVTPPPAAS